MPSYADRNRSLLYALSDFWTQIFADTDVVESAYRGAEILVGQIYLDLLGDMLNMSVRDTALFRKELFRLIRVREDTVLRAPDGRYRVPLGSDIVEASVLNNKVFAVTAALEDGTDYVLVDKAGTSLFTFDPTAAQPVLEHGTHSSALRFTGVLPGEPIAIALDDDGTSPPTAELGYGDTPFVYVRYDGPSNGGTGTASAIAAAITASPTTRERMWAECLVSDGPISSPPALMPTALSFANAAAVAGFGARSFPASFGTKLTAPRTPKFSSELGVSKGDILQLYPGGKSGGIVEVPISLVRDDALYSHFAAMPVGTEEELLTRRDYRILRTPADYLVTGEAWTPFTVTEAVGTVDRATGTIHVPGLAADVAWALMTDAVFLGGALNAGPVTLLSWNTLTERFTFVGTDVADETAVPILRQVSLLGSVTTDLSYSVDSVPDMPGVYDLTGVTGNDACIGGVLFFCLDEFDSTEIFPGARARVIANNGGTLRFTDVSVPGLFDEPYNITGVAILTPVSSTPEQSTRLILDTPDLVDPQAPELRTELLPGSLVVHGRRLCDGLALTEGVDWNYVPAAGGIRWASTPDLRAGVTYDYEIRQVLFDSSDLSDVQTIIGSLEYVSSTDRRVKFPADGLQWSLGDRVDIGPTSGANTLDYGTYYVEELTGGYVILGGLHGNPVLTADAGPTFEIAHCPTATLDIDSPQERIVEIALWAPDIRVDRMSLASTYGYLLGKVEPSSEAYRSTLRGLMQLYMLGPTMARLEAAVHVIAGLPVVRDDNELLLSYERATTATGTGLVLDSAMRRATLLSGGFPQGVFEGYLVVTSGYNAGRVFAVETMVSSTEVILSSEPFNDDGGGLGVSWEVVASDTHAIVTDRNRYPMPITIPFKAELVDPAARGVRRLRAFETFSNAVVVKDETSHPGWWQSARIPAVLWPGQDPARLQSSPEYVEHVFDAVDNPRFGDPGLRLGTDDSGVLIERAVVFSMSGDTAVLRQDPHAPFSYDNATFSSGLFPTSTDHIGYALRVMIADEWHEFTVVGVVDAGTWRVRLPQLLPGGSVVVEDWSLLIDTAVLRHNVAFVVFDRYLKHHVFSVDIDATLLGEIDATLLTEIQARLREVKPADSYMLLSPSSSFTDVLGVEDDLVRQRIIDTSGTSGDAAIVSDNVLRIDGTWRIGDYFRYVDWTRTDAVGANLPIAASPPGYITHVHNVQWLSGVTKGGNPAVLYDEMSAARTLYTGTASIGAADASGGAWITFVANPGILGHASNATLASIVVTTGSQQGTYRIGRIDPVSHALRVYMPGAVPEGPITASIRGTTVFSATVRRQGDGSTTVSAPTGMLDMTGLFSNRVTLEPMTAVGMGEDAINSGLVDPAAPWQLGDQISSAAGVDTFEIGFLLDPWGTSVSLIAAADPYDHGTRVELTLPPTTPLEHQFTPDMGRLNRVANNPSTAGDVWVGIRFTSGPNAGKIGRILEVVTPFYARVISPYDGVEFDADMSASFVIWHYFASTLPAAPVTVPVRVLMDPYSDFRTTPAYDLGGSLGWQDSPMSIDALVSDFVDTANVQFHAYGWQTAVDLGVTPPDPAQGDTLLTIGGLSPSVHRLRRKGQHDFELTELPIEITRTPAP